MMNDVEMGEELDEGGDTCYKERATARVTNIPLTVTAESLLCYLERKLGKDSVYALEILSEHNNWKSRGSGRVQFSTLEYKRLAQSLSVQNSLIFITHNLVVSEAFDDIIERPVKEMNRVEDGELYAGLLKGPVSLCCLERWDGVRGWLMPERKRVEFWVWVEAEKERFKIDIRFEDISETVGYCLGGVNINCVLLKLKYSPRVYQRVSGRHITSLICQDRYHFCKEHHDFVWVRTTDFSAIKSIGHSTCFCWKINESLPASEILTCFPFYTEDTGNLFIEDGEGLCCVSNIVPVVPLEPDAMLLHEIVFQLNSLIHSQKISFAAVNCDLIRTLCDLGSDVATLIIQQLHRSKLMCFDPLTFVKSQALSASMNAKRNSLSHEKLRNMSTTSCHRLLVTPTKVYCLGPEVETSNFVINQFAAYASDFLRVSFVDEDWSKLHTSALSPRIYRGVSAKPFRTKIYHRILSILRDGIVLGSKRYEFLAFSASQLRSGACWMFAPNEKLSAQDIRDWMGCFSNIRCVSKCAARMGQLFSSSVQICDVAPWVVQCIPDIEVTTNGTNYCFSDGIGKISFSLAREVAERCGLDQLPSLFQIRYGGYKGVVAVDRNCFKHLLLRKSMLKFVSENMMLNVTNWSKPMPCFLNREIVTLLTTLGVQDEAFEALLQEQLNLLHKMLSHKREALAALEKLIWADSSNILVRMLNHGYEPSTEPFLSMMLHGYRESLMKEVRSRCRVFVPKGRILIGCLDETRNLEYGQVFVRITKRNSEDLRGINMIHQKADTYVVTGKVFVTRNPCLHPGDIRVLEAVYVPALLAHDLIDCVVFPQKGPRPHPNECSGGDLDGDQFFVCWDEALIPLSTEKPMNYVGGRPRNMDHDVTLKEIEEFFVDYMINDNLGAISTAHLVHSDLEPEKARSEKCLQLAALHSIAVDFAKRGSPAEMPRFLKPQTFPDFMERIDQPMYTSRGILGKLYRAAVAFGEGFSSNGVWTSETAYDHELEVSGFENFLAAALSHRNLYSDKMTSLMNYFGAKSEDEILTGNLRDRALYLQRDTRKYSDIKERMSVGLKNLRREATEWFNSSCLLVEQHLLASAWYHVVYHPNHCKQAVNCLSFPWIMGDKLLSIKSGGIKIDVVCRRH